MTKTRPKKRIVAVQLTDEQASAMSKVQLPPYVNRSSLLKRALDVGLERAIREMTRAFVAEERN